MKNLHLKNRQWALAKCSLRMAINYGSWYLPFAAWDPGNEFGGRSVPLFTFLTIKTALSVFKNKNIPIQCLADDSGERGREGDRLNGHLKWRDALLMSDFLKTHWFLTAEDLLDYIIWWITIRPCLVPSLVEASTWSSFVNIKLNLLVNEAFYFQIIICDLLAQLAVRFGRT